MGLVRCPAMGLLLELGTMMSTVLPVALSAVCSPTLPASMSSVASELVLFDSHKKLFYTDALSSAKLRPFDLKLSARIFKPPGKGSFPAIVINHGSGGLKPYHYDYASLLLKQGFVVAMFDGFCGRDLTSTVGKQESLSLATSVADNYSLLRALSKLSYVDIKNVGAMGTSRGGSTLILASDEKLRRRFSIGDLRFAAFVAVYPGCSTHLKSKSASSTKLLVQLAALDRYFPPEQCRTVFDEMKSQGFRITKTEYEAPHGWDSGSKSVTLPNEYNYGSCNMVVDATGVPVETKSGIRVDSVEAAKLAFKACGKLGAALGGDEKARAASSSELVTFFKRELRN